MRLMSHESFKLMSHKPWNARRTLGASMDRSAGALLAYAGSGAGVASAALYLRADGGGGGRCSVAGGTTLPVLCGVTTAPEAPAGVLVTRWCQWLLALTALLPAPPPLRPRDRAEHDEGRMRAPPPSCVPKRTGELTDVELPYRSRAVALAGRSSGVPGCDDCSLPVQGDA